MRKKSRIIEKGAKLRAIGISHFLNIILCAQSNSTTFFWKFYKEEKDRQEEARAYYKTRYAQYFADAHKRINVEHSGDQVNFVCTREDGTYINPRTMQHTSAIIHSQLNIPEFDYHSLRHPYVKPTTKNLFFQKQKSQTTNYDLMAWVFCFRVLCRWLWSENAIHCPSFSILVLD